MGDIRGEQEDEKDGRWNQPTKYLQLEDGWIYRWTQIKEVVSFATWLLSHLRLELYLISYLAFISFSAHKSSCFESYYSISHSEFYRTRCLGRSNDRLCPYPSTWLPMPILCFYLILGYLILGFSSSSPPELYHILNYIAFWVILHCLIIVPADWLDNYEVRCELWLPVCIYSIN